MAKIMKNCCLYHFENMEISRYIVIFIYKLNSRKEKLVGTFASQRQQWVS